MAYITKLKGKQNFLILGKVSFGSRILDLLVAVTSNSDFELCEGGEASYVWLHNYSKSSSWNRTNLRVVKLVM